MKSKLGKKLHTSILTCLGLVFGLSLFLFNPDTVSAACSGVDTAGSFKCSLSNGTVVYCDNNSECIAYKNQNLPSSSTYTQDGKPWNQFLDWVTQKPRQKYFPDQGCDQGINSALGCIPYTTEAFGPALFGLLVGTAGMFALILMLFATFLYITSGGDQEKLKKAKELFTAAVTGLLFIIFSVVLLRITAGDILEVPGF
jgi:hypothetical protein